MRTKHGFLLGLVFVIGCVTGGVASQLAVPPVRAGTNPARWEYHCFKGIDGLTEAANQMGAQGWEMVAAAGANANAVAPEFMWCFKRPLS
jgi:hypothetical protein